jgi:hypothetical protein
MQEYQGQPYQGWSSTYTVSAVLQQLYGFLLLDDSVDHESNRWANLGRVVSC